MSSGRSTKADTEAVRAAVLALEDAKGRITPDRVLRAAADPKSPLHGEFEWNDGKAAHAYRIDQARRLIVSVRVTVTVEACELPISRYVRDPRVPAHEQGYVDVEKLVRNPGPTRAMVRYEIERAMAVVMRARGYAKVADMEDELKALVAALADDTVSLVVKLGGKAPDDPLAAAKQKRRRAA